VDAIFAKGLPGTLDSFSAFPFESHLFSIKRMIHNSPRPVAQIMRRTSEKEQLPPTSSNASTFGNVQMCTYKGQKAFCLHGILFSTVKPDHVVIIDAKPRVLTDVSVNVSGNIVVQCRDFLNLRSLFTLSMDSSTAYIFRASQLSTEVCTFSVCHILFKCIALPLNDFLVIYPMP
ncbi:unnamed protein product, partial [Dicrocoelium dendriticum]